MKRRAQWLLLAMIGAIISVLLVLRQEQEEKRDSSLAARLERVVRIGTETELPCSEVAAMRPLVILALGQSNAANHGSPGQRPWEPVTLVAEGKCISAVDPLPGGTGTGGSIWQRLPAALRELQTTTPVVVSVLAVEASSIDEWTRRDSALRQRLMEHVASLRRVELMPAFVLWQQGEADARNGIKAAEYAQQLEALTAIIEAAGAHAPIILARSTICRSAPNDEIRNAIESKTVSDHRFRLGPDTDLLSGERFRYDGCHLTTDGLRSAARMWAASITGELSAASPPPRQAMVPDSAPRIPAQSGSTSRAGQISIPR